MNLRQQFSLSPLTIFAIFTGWVMPNANAVINLGAIFQPDNMLGRAAFAYSVNKIDKQYRTRNFNARLETVASSDAFKAAQTTCDLLLAKSIAIFGPNREPGTSQVRSLCDTKEIPHIMTGFSENGDLPEGSKSFSINVFPPPRAIGRALADIVTHYAWKSLVIVYEFSDGLIQMQDLLQLSSVPQGPRVTLRQLPGGNKREKHYTPLLKEIKDRMEQFHIVVHAGLESGRQFLEQAESLRMVGDYYHYLFTNLDLYTLDVESYKQSGCNITGIRLVDTEAKETTDIIRDLRSQSSSFDRPLLPTIGVQTEAAVIHDSVMAVAIAVNKLGDSLVPDAINCDSDQSWQNGTTFLNYLKMTEFHGTTGFVSFDSYGQRSNYEITVVELGKEGFLELGKWNSTTGLNITKSYEKSLSDIIETLENKTLRVSVYLEEPFVMYKESIEKLDGNDRYEGYCIDLLEEISKYRKFNYSINVVKDNSYGAKEADGRWNGMVGELQRGEADLAAASLTITYSRSEVIDFTVPFMHLGISILFKKPEKKDPSLFTFLSPLSLDVWVYMLAAYVGVSLMLWILARFSPYEWYNPHPCNPDTDVVENQFNLLNSLWFTVGSLMQQGSDIAPRAASTRLVAGIWWFFTLILISSYTANLAAFLTVERMVSPIESADDLAKQTKIKYGSLNRGSTMTFFKESKIQTYERMWAFMESAQPTVFVNKSSEGILRVKQGDYAYLMESSMLEYYIERDCELMQIGGLLDSKGYGIGLPKGSPYREPISSAILMLQEKTILTELKEKWWKRERGGGKCKGDDANKKGQHNELGLQNVGGVFVLLLGGLCLAFIIAIIEFVYKSSQNAEIDKVTPRSLCSEMWQELQFAMRCQGSKKPARRKHSIIGYIDDGKGGLTPSVSYGGYTAVPTKADSFLYNNSNNRS